MDRLEEIKGKFVTEEMPVHTPAMRKRFGESRRVKRWTGDVGDVQWLLERVEKLESYKHGYEIVLRKVEELEEENERLREHLGNAHFCLTTLTWGRGKAGAIDELERAIHPGT